jgi:hypothetical protein
LPSERGKTVSIRCDWCTILKASSGNQQGCRPNKLTRLSRCPTTKCREHTYLEGRGSSSGLHDFRQSAGNSTNAKASSPAILPPRPFSKNLQLIARLSLLLSFQRARKTVQCSIPQSIWSILPHLLFMGPSIVVTIIIAI